jgi:AcrR family transcriptional regulator
MGRPKVGDAQQRRAAIIDHAYEAFIELGFAGTTTEIVATRAKISKRAIYELFSGKAQLFAAVVLKHRHLILDLPRPTDEDIPVIEKLVKIFRLEMDRQRDIEREALLNLIIRESVQFPELSDLLYNQGIIRSREDLMEWLEAEARRGTIDIEDTALCAGMLMDIVFGALLPRRRQHGDAARELRKEDIRKRLEIFLRGVRPA